MDSTAIMDIMRGFKACTRCTHTCYTTHGFDAAAKAPDDEQFTRPPCFLVNSVEAQKSWLPIPKEFVRVHGDSLRGSVNLEDPNGKVWVVDVSSPPKPVGFRDGWKAFIASTNVNRVNGKRKRDETNDEVSDESEDDSSESSDYEVSNLNEVEDSISELEPEQDQANSQPKREMLDCEEITSNRNGSSRKKVTSRANRTPSHRKKEPLDSVKKDCNLEPGWNSTTYASRRREITEKERERTMEAALSFKTKNPSQHVLMKPSHVYRGFWLTIPNKYSQEHMPQERVKIKLQDSYGFQWSANWIRSDNHSGVSGGWHAFSCDHALEEGDVCVFEVIDSKDWTVLVHIFRAVEIDLVPGTRGGWHKTYDIIFANGKGGSKQKQARPRSKKVFAAYDADVDDEIPLKSSHEVKATVDTKAEEVDVKPKIESMGLTPRPMTRSAAVKVKQENGLRCVDVKPTLEQLSASLKPIPNTCDVFPYFEEKPKIRFTPGIVKPEPVEAPVVVDERTWYQVVRLANKRQSKTSSEKEFQVELGGLVLQKSSSGRAVKDENGLWWVPFSQFSPDFSRLLIFEAFKQESYLSMGDSPLSQQMVTWFRKRELVMRVQEQCQPVIELIENTGSSRFKKDYAAKLADHVLHQATTDFV